MNKTKLVDGLDGQCELGDVKAGYVFGEGDVFDEHSHEISTREELHEHV